MKSTRHLKILSCIFLACFLVSCSGKDSSNARNELPPAEPQAQQYTGPPQLPVRYQTPSYVASVTSPSDLESGAKEDYQMKVGATIRSNTGPQPLWDVMKRLANLKGMTVSWSSDVNLNFPVDVDISANDYFFEAVDHLLRQADYFHETQGKTIIVKYKDTKVFQIGLPFMKAGYVSTVGGNFLASRESSGKTGTEGTVKITSDQNVFDVWDNIAKNMDMILASYTYDVPQKQMPAEAMFDNEAAETVTNSNIVNRPTTAPGGQKVATQRGRATETKSTGLSYYTIDKSVGMISVTAPKPLLAQVENYLERVKKELFRQVAIEAKIIEVYLEDSSQLGLDWSSLLGGKAINASAMFGDGGIVYDGYKGTAQAMSKNTGNTKFLSAVAIPQLDFSVLLHALNEQGETHVLSNPRLTVMNGQPALISVGKDHTYVKSVEKDVDKENDEVTYTAEVEHLMEGVALGVIPSIIDAKKVVLHLTPITTELVDGVIEYQSYGDEGLIVGVPKVNIRQMSTTVEVKNGEMLVIGGLIDSIEKNTDSFAPVVGNIPIIKYLFGVEKKEIKRRELVIILTPNIL